MSARHKLNQACVNGALLLAGLVGACAESWTVFLTLLVILVGLSIHAGDIRTSSTRRPEKQRRRRDN
tara:strand:+ start:2650 stop:2850 length:201 start_codon:yes stop_codon:yes gene_type:complete